MVLECPEVSAILWLSIIATDIKSAIMNLKIYQVDAFASAIFHGNPAAVCPLEAWLAKEQMQNIAMENNLAETAFFVKEEDGYACAGLPLKPR
jgi:hypothetical protein